MGEEDLNSVQTVWLSGSTLVVSIPRRVKEVKGIKKGDYIKVLWGDILKKGTDKVENVKNNKKKKEVKVMDADFLPDLT